MAGVLALVSLALLGPIGSLPVIDAPYSMPWWFLALLSAVAELFIVHFQLRRAAYSSTLGEVPLVIGLVFTTPLGLVLARLVGTGAALVLHGRQSGVKLAFNLVHEVCNACVALVLFHAFLGGALPNELRGWAAASATMLLIHALSPVLVTSAISLYEGRSQFGALTRLIALDLLSTATNTSLGLVAVIVVWADARGAWLLIVVGVVVHAAFRSYTSLSHRYERLGLLYGFTDALSATSVQPTEVVETMLAEARILLQADVAELILFGTPPVRATSREGTAVETVLIDPPSQHQAWWQPAATGEPIVIGRRASGPDRERLDRAGRKDAMAAPLRRGSDVLGVLLLADRLGEASTFGAEDLKLFETMANHATVSLENGRLVQRLQDEAAEKEHQALHDSMTGLPNRRLFERQVGDAITATALTGRHVAVLVMDLDRFKEVNDTLGHHTGDLLLSEIGRRLRQTLDGTGTIARLGGDEFAVLLPDVTDGAEAARHAGGILHALEAPIELEGVTLEVGASIGLALAPAHGHTAELLLQRADIAMYAAKTRRSGLETYEAADNQFTRRRLSLVAELRQAIAEQQLVVHYQPKVDLPGGRVTGFEALVRWNHPEHGFLPPDEFIPLAEQTGLIRPLTTFVLHDALARCRAWRAMGQQVGVAVNLSVRSLVDPTLPDEVARMLASAGVPPSALTLEITESSIMVDPGRSAAVLERLHELGVTVSIDDFGTGYSSLTYLRRLPVGEVKIDRSFVIGMATDDDDAAIVESIIVLAHNLGIRVVAEGVETEETRDWLATLGCDTVQGYFFSRPLPEPAASTWLEHRSPVTATTLHAV